MSRLTRIAPPAAQPVSAETLAEHLRVTIAAPETDQLDELSRLILAATRHLETRLDMAFIEQSWRWRLTSWADTFLPLQPVLSLNSAAVIDNNGVADPAEGVSLDINAARPKLIADSTWPPIPKGGYAEIEFTAGFGASQEDVPEDLRQAVLLLAAHFYENREAVSQLLTTMPLGVASLIAAYRPLRL